MQTLDGANSENIHYVAVGGTTDAEGNPVDVVLADNGAVTQSFLSWDWDLEYTTFAPYLNLGFQVSEQLYVDAGIRRDSVEAAGRRLDGCCGGNVDADLNGNGVIDPLLESTAGVSAGFITGGVRVLNENSSAVTNVNYDADNTSFTLGAAYLLSDDSSVFARFSSGGRAIGDRLTQIGGALNTDGSLTRTTDGYDDVEQFEVGYKKQGENWDVYVTLFDTAVEETNAEITSGLTFIREYEATGIELEGNTSFGNGFSVSGNVTWVDAEIARDANNQSIVGNTPRRQADVIYTITPEYAVGNFAVGASIVGSTEFYMQDNNDLKQDAYNLVHLFARYDITEDLVVTFNVNNLTDEFVVTEAEEGSAARGAFVRARPLSGRSSAIGVRYSF